MNNKHTTQLEFDRQHIWHPYTSMTNPLPSYFVETANGVEITLANNITVIDGMSSWWAVIHGYNHPRLNQAIYEQTEKVAHVMFGGLTHQPAVDLCTALINIAPANLEKVFLSDSGSVAVEVAIKMALQFWQNKQTKESSNLSSPLNNSTKPKSRLLTVKNGYHGDTFAAMSVCDPVNGMHQLFEQVLQKSVFAPAPTISFNDSWDDNALNDLRELFKQHNQSLAAFIIEPIVQGAGGMRIYHPQFLKGCRQLCDQYDVLMIVDEIATGFGRTGKLFACEWADVSPDILCLGKALTGGYMTLAATLCTDEIAKVISEGDAGCFMHGPTFMGNPLACSVANASLAILAENNWQQQVQSIEQQLKKTLLPLIDHPRVQDTRVLGAIGVVEVKTAVNMQHIQKRFVELGVWIRPFGKLIYLMPPYIISEKQLSTLVNAIEQVLSEDECFSA